MNPSLPLPEGALSAEQLAALEQIAAQSGRTVEQLVWTAIDQYILSETGQLN